MTAMWAGTWEEDSRVLASAVWDLASADRAAGGWQVAAGRPAQPRSRVQAVGWRPVTGQASGHVAVTVWRQDYGMQQEKEEPKL